jgi:hypothetical protein
LLIALLLGGGLAVGCDADSAARGGGDAGAPDSVGSAGAAGTPATGGQGGGSGAGGAGVITGSRVFAGTAGMLRNGPPCTHEVGATGDRWCAFVAFSTSGRNSLFVVDVSQVVAGVTVTCGAADPSCLLLTPTLGGDGALHGTFFQGDTLVYYDESVTPHAWRPGMAGGRRLATVSAEVDAAFCTPARAGTAVACLALLATQTEVGFTRGDLLAGKADGADEPLLSVIDSIIVTNEADRRGVSRFSFGFPGVGDYVAWTSRETATGPEILKLQVAGDPGSKMTVASDVHGWDVSPDGTQWFWLSAIDSTGIGTLQTAPFPGGASPTDVLADAWQYGLLPAGRKTVVAVTRTGELVAIADPVAAPAAQVALDAPVQRILSFSGQGHVAYAKSFLGRSLVDLSVRKVDGTEACVVDPNTSTPFVSVHFSPDAGALVSARSKTGGFDGVYTRLSDCSVMPLAPDVVALTAVGDLGVVFKHQPDPTAPTGTMRFRRVAAGNLLHAETPMTIATHVDTYVLSGSAPGALVYTVNGGGDADGVYIHPFGRR